MATCPKWTLAEEQFLRQLRNQGKSYREIAKRLGRTEAAVSQRLNAPRGACGIRTIRRNKMNYHTGEIYYISPIIISNSCVSFLPARFFFVGRSGGLYGRPVIYRFQSVVGNYSLTFTIPQIRGAYIIQKISKGGKICNRHGESGNFKISFRGWKDGKVREVPCPQMTS